MRPGRPLAAASALAAAVGASLAASPALAAGNLKFADDQQNVVSHGVRNGLHRPGRGGRCRPVRA